MITGPVASEFSAGPRFLKVNGRLARFEHGLVEKAHWEERWSKANIKAYLGVYASGKLGEFERIFTRYLPRDLRVLEAGCGQGQLVMALSARGYQVEGIDYAEKTIDRVRAAAPQLNVRVGDIYNLDVPDGAYGGYISIGLFEHNVEGPQQGLREARRVLHPRGVALISVPYLNSRRARLLKQVDAVARSETKDGMNFYQYYFSREDFQTQVEAAGLQVVECYPYGVYAGLTRDFASVAWLTRQRWFIWRAHRVFSRWCSTAPNWARFRAAHMLMFTCKPN